MLQSHHLSPTCLHPGNTAPHPMTLPRPDTGPEVDGARLWAVHRDRADKSLCGLENPPWKSRHPSQAHRCLPVAQEPGSGHSEGRDVAQAETAGSIRPALTPGAMYCLPSVWGFICQGDGQAARALAGEGLYSQGGGMRPHQISVSQEYWAETQEAEHPEMALAGLHESQQLTPLSLYLRLYRVKAWAAQELLHGASGVSQAFDCV